MIPFKSLPQAEYLKQDDIGLVIAKGMAVTYKAQPKNPIDFFGKWLLNQALIQKNQEALEEKDKIKRDIKDRYAYELKNKKKEQEFKLKKEEEKQQKIQSFRDKIKASRDLEEEMQGLVDHLHENTGATAVYIGKVVNPLKKIKDDDNDRAHIDVNGVPQIQFQYSSSEHEFLVDKVLKQEEGVTYDLFREDEKEDKEATAEEDEEGEPKEKPEKLPKCILVYEVVREPRIHYFDVPKLGSYFTIKLEYDSCLFEEAFDSGLQDYIEVEQKRAEQAKEKHEFEEAQALKKQEFEDARESSEQQFVPEERVFPEINYAPFKTKKVQYAVCLNTMGQDRNFTEDQKLFALRIVQEFRDRWEQVENENLFQDIKAKVERSHQDIRYKEKYEDQDNFELERVVQEAVQYQQHPEGDDQGHPEEKNIISFKTRFVQITKTFYAPDLYQQHKAKLERLQKESLRSGGGDRTSSALGSGGKDGDDKSIQGQYFPLSPEQWKEKVRELKNLYVLKFPRIFQSLFYLFKYKERQTICERDTNKIQWKKAKQFLNDELFMRIGDYWPFGVKDETYKEYEKLKFIKRNLEEYQEEQVDEYSVALGKLLRWIKYAITARTEDVKIRRAIKKRLKQERQDAIKLEQARLEKRKAQFEEKRAEFNEKVDAQIALRKEQGEEEDDYRPEFDAEEFYNTFDEQNFPVDIPDEVIDEIDNDFNIEIKEEGEADE